MASGSASRNEGSTPSGMGIPSIVNADASPLVPGCSLSGAVEGTAESPSEVTAVVCCGAPAREKTNQEKVSSYLQTVGKHHLKITICTIMTISQLLLFARALYC